MEEEVTIHTQTHFKMGKSSRSSAIKKNNQVLKKKVFGPVETARIERQNAKLLELAKAPKELVMEDKPEGKQVYKTTLWITGLTGVQSQKLRKKPRPPKTTKWNWTMRSPGEVSVKLHVYRRRGRCDK